MKRPFTAVLALLLAALALAACGSGDGGAGTTATSSARTTTTPSPSRPSAQSRAGAAQFEVGGGDNSIQEFGAEASGADFEAAATALHGYLDARAARAWRAACSYMSPLAAASLAQLSGESGRAGCPELLASLSAGIPAVSLREAASADVGALRTEGGRAFLLFHGAHGTDYFIPMALEGGSWKVAAIAASAIP